MNEIAGMVLKPGVYFNAKDHPGWKREAIIDSNAEVVVTETKFIAVRYFNGKHIVVVTPYKGSAL